MQIKITPFNFKHRHLEGIFIIRNNYYLAEFHSAGIVTEIKKSDDWLEKEMSWVSRSEIPFVTAIRHSQIKEAHLIEGALTPVVRRFGPFFKIKSVDKFPSKDECRQLIYKYCDYSTDGDYHFYKHKTKREDIENLKD